MTALSRLWLTDVAAAAGRVAVAAPKLAAEEVWIAAAPIRLPLTNVRITTRDQANAEDVAHVLRLDENSGGESDAPGWSGYPVLHSGDISERAMRVEVALLAGLPDATRSLTLQEASDLLDLVAGVVDVPVVRVHLRTRGEQDDRVEIHTADSRSAQRLVDELAYIDLPLQPVALPAVP